MKAPSDAPCGMASSLSLSVSRRRRPQGRVAHAAIIASSDPTVPAQMVAGGGGTVVLLLRQQRARISRWNLKPEICVSMIVLVF